MVSSKSEKTACKDDNATSGGERTVGRGERNID